MLFPTLHFPFVFLLSSFLKYVYMYLHIEMAIHSSILL